jgi:hypothetical protein
MLFNSFSDMTLMVCVETIVIKPRNISRKLDIADQDNFGELRR